MIEVKVEGLDYVRERVSPKRFRRVAEAFMEKSAKFIEVEAAGRSPIRTGRLARSIKARGSGLSWTVGTGVEYAGFMEFGTRPHYIFPRRAQALRFVVDGVVVFARWVFHPGTRPYKFMERAVMLWRRTRHLILRAALAS